MEQRLPHLMKLSELLMSQKETLAHLITSEMGKPIRESRAEIEKCAWLARFLSNEEVLGLQSRPVNTEGKAAWVSYEPLGLIFAIMPWNFPFWQALRLALPAMAAGNGVLLKHAPNVFGAALALEKLCEEAGFPPGLFTALNIPVKDTEIVIAHPAVRAVSLTGSESAGKSVAALAGKYLKKSVLELGGSDAFIVFPDADLPSAAKAAVQSRMLNSGQVCIAAKRFIVHEKVMDAFTENLAGLLLQLRMGDPIDENTDMGPLARPDLTLQLEAQLEQSLRMGAQCLTGGKRAAINPEIFEPTLLINIAPEMPVWKEETFGPLMPVMSFRDTAEAIRLANDSRFGLGASIWTKDLNFAQQIMPQLEAGAIFVNSIVKSDPRLPFGGIKNSGYGRELSLEGIKEFVNIKSNWIS